MLKTLGSKHISCDTLRLQIQSSLADRHTFALARKGRTGAIGAVKRKWHCLGLYQAVNFPNE